MENCLWKVMCGLCVLLSKPTGSLQLEYCGHAPLNNRIVGGENADPGAWPWQVSFQVDGKHFCGGSLISEDWVLSAAHCFQSVFLPNVTVYLGIHSLNLTTSNTTQRENIMKIISHSEYDKESNRNDIALVMLSSSVNFTSYVQPMCLASVNSSLHDINATVTGFGKNDSNTYLSPTQILQEVQVPIVNDADCTIKYYGFHKDYMICAGLAGGGRDACQGDSGGPLMIKQNNTWVQVGIVSFGNKDGCGLPKYPGVYTRVSNYQKWVNNCISNNRPIFVTVSSSNCVSPNLFCLFFSFHTILFLVLQHFLVMNQTEDTSNTVVFHL